MVCRSIQICFYTTYSIERDLLFPCNRLDYALTSLARSSSWPSCRLTVKLPSYRTITVTRSQKAKWEKRTALPKYAA